MQKIIPHLWYDKEAFEAVTRYTTLFQNSKILHSTTISDTPSGDTELVDFQLEGMKFSSISAGPYFEFNPSVSLMIGCDSVEEVDRLYNELIKDGFELMPLGEYPFSKRYAWISDQYGLNWQLMYDENRNEHAKIRPNLLFTEEMCGKAMEAIEYYHSVFPDSTIGHINHYAEGEAQDPKAEINYGELTIGETEFVVMDHGYGGDFSFNEAISFMVVCEDQEEIDYYWDKLSFVPEAEQCGWVKDQFGVSWQIVPSNLNEIMMQGTKEEVQRITQAFLQMKKFDLKALEEARLG